MDPDIVGEKQASWVMISYERMLMTNYVNSKFMEIEKFKNKQKE